MICIGYWQPISSFSCRKRYLFALEVRQNLLNLSVLGRIESDFVSAHVFTALYGWSGDWPSLHHGVLFLGIWTARHTFWRHEQARKCAGEGQRFVPRPGLFYNLWGARILPRQVAMSFSSLYHLNLLTICCCSIARRSYWFCDALPLQYLTRRGDGDQSSWWVRQREYAFDDDDNNDMPELEPIDDTPFHH